MLLALLFFTPTSNDNIDAVTYLPLAASILSACTVVYLMERRSSHPGLLGKLLERFGLYGYSIYLFHPFVTPFLYVRSGNVALDVPEYLHSLPALLATVATVLVFITLFAAFFVFW